MRTKQNLINKLNQIDGKGYTWVLIKNLDENTTVNFRHLDLEEMN